MHIDHQKTVKQLQVTAATNIYLADQTKNSLFIAAAKSNAEKLTKIAEYHQEKADEINRQINLTKLHQSATKSLLKL